MADSFLAYQNPPITDKKLDSESLVVGGNTVERERIQISGIAAADIAPVSSTLGLFVNATNASFVVTQGTGSNLHTLVDNAAGASAVNIQDGGNTITVDGTITANAGTDLNTSLLLLDSTFTGRINTFGQKAMAASTPVVIASDQSAIAVTVGSVPSNQSVNVAQIAGTATSVNNGTVDAGTIRVTLASNSTGQVTVANAAGASAVNIQDGGNSITVDGTVTANQGGAPWSVTGSGTLTNNNLPPASNNVGVLPALVTYGPPVYTNNNQALLSVDTDGNLRTTSAPASPLSDALFEILQELKDMKELLLSIAG